MRPIVSHQGNGPNNPIKHVKPPKHGLTPTKPGGNTGTKPNRNKGKFEGKRKGPGGRIASVVNAEIRSGVKDARREGRIVRRQASRERRKAELQYKRQKGDLNYIFGETQDYIKGMGDSIQANYTAQTSRAQAAQSDLLSQLTANSTAVGGGLGAELSRLGLSGVDQSDFAADAGNAQNLAMQQGANNLANINAQASGASDISNLLGGMVQGSKLSMYGQAQNALRDQMSQIYEDKHEGINQVRDAIHDLRGSRKDLTLQMMQQLGGSHWGRYLRGGKKHKSSGGSSGYSNYSGNSGNSGGTYSSSGGGGSRGGGRKPGNPSGGRHDINSLLLSGITKPRRR